MEEQPRTLLEKTLTHPWDDRRTVIDVLLQAFFKLLSGVVVVLETLSGSKKQ